MIARLSAARRLRHAALLLWSGLLLSCTASVTDTPVVSAVALTPPTATVESGRTVVLVARATDEAGAAVTSRPVAWSSNNTAVATVSGTGVVTARDAGEARIAASVDGQSAVANITVTAREVASVQVTPVVLSVRVQRSAPLSARALDADGGELANRPISWSSADPGIATVNAQGVVTAVTVGVTTVTATSAGRSGTAAITVTPEPVATVSLDPTLDTLAVGTEVALTATARDEDGAVLTGRTVAWSVSDADVALVSSNGVVTARAPGEVTVVAVSEGRVGQATIVVLQRLANAITLTPASSTIETGSTLQLVAQITDANGNLIPGRVVTYASDAPAVAEVNGTGLVTARAPGTVRITATSDGRSTSATVTVVTVPIVSVTVLPEQLQLAIGNTRVLAAQARSAIGTLIAGRPIAWTSGAPSIATVDPSGVVRAIAPGVAVIAATVDGVTGFSTVTVPARTVGSVQLLPDAPELLVGGQLQIVAVVRDAQGNQISEPALSWQSSNEAVAFVTSSGVVIGISSGTAIISATSGGVSGSTIVTIR
jgi:uncharacterized protein YjdB